MMQPTAPSVTGAYRWRRWPRCGCRPAASPSTRPGPGSAPCRSTGRRAGSSCTPRCRPSPCPRSPASGPPARVGGEQHLVSKQEAWRPKADFYVWPLNTFEKCRSTEIKVFDVCFGEWFSPLHTILQPLSIFLQVYVSRYVAELRYRPK